MLTSPLNGKTIDELEPKDVRALSDAELIELQHFLNATMAQYSTKWFTTTQRWATAGLLEYVTRHGVEERGLTKGRFDLLEGPDLDE